MRYIRATLIGLVLTCPSYLRAADPKKPAPRLTYDEHVLPILRDKCLACHSQDKKSGGLRLHTYTNILAGGSSGVVVKPGDPEGSSLYLVTSHRQEPHMPPKSPP